MTLIGMLHHRKDPNTVKKSYAYAAVAKAEGADLIYFTLKNVNFDKKKINGYIYINGDWKKTESPFPDVIYNVGSPGNSDISNETFDKLKEMIPFTSNSIGNKMSVYTRLKKAGEFSKYLIPSEYIHSSKELLDFLNIHHKIVFKPIVGHQGQGVTFIEKVDTNYKVLINTKNFIYNYDQFVDFVSEIVKEETYLAQPYINCKTKSGNAYDFRLHVQKDGLGSWVITSVYPRIGASGSIVSNISSGGATNTIDPFLKQEFGDDFFNIKRYLEVFSLQLANHMEKLQHQYFSESIDELGIDVGLDENKKIWIYEINWRPGCPPIFYLELDVVKNTIRYAMFLAAKKKNNNI